MKTKLLGLAFGLSIGLATALPAQASVVTFEFTASGLENAGTAYPGFSGPITGRFSWEQSNVGDPIAALIDIDLSIGGHSYTLAEVGVAWNSVTQSAIGGAARGFNAVVGDGQFDDFLLVFDRVNPAISAFAYSIQGKTNAIWWQPTFSEAQFVTNDVPEPMSALLVLTGLGLLGVQGRRALARKAAD